MADIRNWLESRGLGKHAEMLIDNEIDWSVLPDLTDDELKELGLPLGARKKLLKAVASITPVESGAPATSLPQDAAPRGAEHRQLTVMFCDLANSTALSAAMHAEDYRDLINAFQQAVTRVLREHNGYVARYMGDGLLAYFGYPRAEEHDPIRATRAGLEVVDAVRALVTPTSLSVRVGIATGAVLVGDIIGEGAAEEAAVVGATPNLAARLQSAAAPDSVVISANTQSLLADQVETAALDPLTLKGFAEPVTAYRALRNRTLSELSHARRDMTAMVGREVEVALLERAWQNVQQSEGQALLLLGDAGVGKSRLLRAFRATIATGARTLVQWHCSPLHQSTANHPSKEQLRFVIHRGGADDAQAAQRLHGLLTDLGLDPGRWVPALALLTGTTIGDGSPAESFTADRIKRELVDVQLQLLLALARQRPVLFVVEDLHWADPSTLDVLHRMIAAARDLPVLFLMTARTGFNPTWDAEPHAQTHRLHNISRRDAVLLINSLAGEVSLGEELMEQIIEHADGVPLYIEEITKHVLASHGADEVPTSLQDSLMARLDRLGSSRELAQAAAVIGRRFTADALAVLLEWTQDTLASLIEQLLAAGLVHGKADGSYEFKHALIRDAAYGSLLRARQRELHARYADYLRTTHLGESSPELLARHLQSAQNIPEAIAQWASAGDQALALGAQAEAAQHFQHAVALCAQLDTAARDDREELSILLRLGQAQFGAFGGAAPETAATFSRAAQLAEACSNMTDQCRAYYGQWLGAIIAGQVDQAEAKAQQILDLAQAQRSDWADTVGQRLMGTVAYLSGNLELARQYLIYIVESRKILEDGPRGFGHDPYLTAVSTLAHVEWAMGRIDHALSLSLENVRSLDPDTANPNTISYTLSWHVLLALFCRRHDLADSSARELAAHTERSGGRFWANISLWGMGARLVREGDAEKGIALLVRGRDGFLATGARQHIPGVETWIAEGWLALGDIDSALATLARAEALLADTRQFFYAPEIYRNRGLAYADSDNMEAARESFEQAMGTARAQGAVTLELRSATSLASLMLEHGDAGGATALLAPLYDRFADEHESPDVVNARAVLVRTGAAT